MIYFFFWVLRTQIGLLRAYKRAVCLGAARARWVFLGPIRTRFVVRKIVERLAKRPATGAVDGEDVMELGLPTPDQTDPETAGPESPLSALIVWGGP